MINLDGGVVIVTGSASGSGAATARMLSERGSKVVINYSRSAEKAESVAKECKALGAEVILQQADVSKDEDCRLMARVALDKWGRIDGLVNNAGTNRPEHFTKIKKEDMEYVVDLNIKAAFHVAQLGSKIMLKSKKRKLRGGSIINMSSQLGKVGAPNRSVYNMTKFGLEGLTKGMAIDLAKNNIRVNTVCPTFIVTPMTKKFLKNKKFKSSILKNIPLGRFADVSDVATAVTFLASDASSMITGTSILIDGGWTAQ